MTHNNISYLEALEKKRSNLAQEAETRRANFAKEILGWQELEEKKRSNLVSEYNAQAKAQLEYEAKMYATDKDYAARESVARINQETSAYTTGLQTDTQLAIAGVQAAASERSASIHAGASLAAAQVNAQTQLDTARINAETQRYINDNTLDVRRDELSVTQQHNWATEWIQTQGIAVDYASIAQRQEAAAWTHSDRENELVEANRHNMRMEEEQHLQTASGTIAKIYGSTMSSLPGIAAMGGN